MSYQTRLQLDPKQILDGHVGRNAEYLNAWEGLVEAKSCRRVPFPASLSARLLERIADTRNLELAWEHVHRRGGPAPGPDGIRSDDWFQNERWDAWRILRSAILSGEYRPAQPAVIRKKKPSGGHREICIYNLTDRVAQRAIVQILQPVLDPTFDKYSFGSRPGRGRLSALAALEAVALRSGRRTAVLVDFQKAFNSIPRARLAQVLRNRIPNSSVVDLIVRIVEAREAKKGIPQGAPISPLLMNLYADHFVDRPWRERHPGDSLIRYVDNVCIAAETVDHGKDLYAEFAEVARPHGLLLNEDVVAAVKSPSQVPATWLGFQLEWAADSLVFGLSTTWETDLRESLIDCHRKPDPVRRANAVVRGVVEEAGPALEHFDPDRFYRQVMETAAECEFREIVPPDVFRLRCERSVRRWQRIRRAAHRLEGLQSVSRSRERRPSQMPSLGCGQFEIFTDGSCLSQHGIGGWACILRKSDRADLWEIAGGLRNTSNSRAELSAVINGLAVTAPGSTVHIVTDSRYVLMGLRGYRRWRRHGWKSKMGKPIANQRLWQRLAALVEEREVVSHWVPGHSGHVENELADELALRAAKRLERRLR